MKNCRSLLPFSQSIDNDDMILDKIICIMVLRYTDGLTISVFYEMQVELRMDMTCSKNLFKATI